MIHPSVEAGLSLQISWLSLVKSGLAIRLRKIKLILTANTTNTGIKIKDKTSEILVRFHHHIFHTSEVDLYTYIKDKIGENAIMSQRITALTTSTIAKTKSGMISAIHTITFKRKVREVSTSHWVLVFIARFPMRIIDAKRVKNGQDIPCAHLIKSYSLLH